VLRQAREALARVRYLTDRVDAGLGREGAEWGREQAEVQREMERTERDRSEAGDEQ
jgi:hypothetical protein